MCYNLNKISENLKSLEFKYEDWDCGGCGYVALYIYENLKKKEIDSDIKILSHYEPFEWAPHCLTIENIDNFGENYGILIFHIINKIDDDLFIDLKGIRNKNELYKEFGKEICSISYKALKYALKDKTIWNEIFRRKNAFKLKQDINSAFKNI